MDWITQQTFDPLSLSVLIFFLFLLSSVLLFISFRRGSAKSTPQPQFSRNDQRLLAAASRGDRSEIRQLLNNLTSEPRDHNQNTPLHLACLGGHVEATKELLSWKLSSFVGLNVNGLNPIHSACLGGNVAVLPLLLHHYDSIKNTINKQNNPNSNRHLLNWTIRAEEAWTPLHMACIKGHASVVRFLIDHGADINAQDGRGHTPLIIASCNGYRDIVEILLKEKNVNIRLRDKTQQSCLFFAAQNGYLPIVELLLEKRRHILDDPTPPPKLAKVQQNNQSKLEVDDDEEQEQVEPETQDILEMAMMTGNKPIHAACFRGFDSIVSALLKAGCDMHSVNRMGNTPLHVSVTCSDQDAACKAISVLLSNGANISAPSCFGNTPLHDACWKAKPQIVRLLLEHCSKQSEKKGGCLSVLKDQDYDGQFPLHKAVKSNQADDVDDEDTYQVTKLLLEFGADPNCCDYGDCTPLHILCCSPINPMTLRLVELLLANGADVTRENCIGWNALHFSLNSKKQMADSSRKKKRMPEDLPDQIYALLRSRSSPEFLANFDPEKPRDTKNSDRFHSRKGAHNRIPESVRAAVLEGDHTLSKIAQIIKNNNPNPKTNRPLRILVLTGAGISVSCGIPDFRSPTTGIYNDKQFEGAFDISTFLENPALFYELVRKIFLPIVRGNVKPSLSHFFITLLHQKGLLRRHYTQNIDLLERIAGLPSRALVEAHGSFASATCTNAGCRQPADMSDFWRAIQRGEVPRCRHCAPELQASVVKPDVVFFGEGIPERFVKLRDIDCRACDLLIVMGTSLIVYPFAAMVNEVPLLSPRLLINREKTGPFAVEASHGTSNYRDVAFIGECDAGVLELSDLLGWKDELLEMSSNWVFKPFINE